MSLPQLKEEPREARFDRRRMDREERFKLDMRVIRLRAMGKKPFMIALKVSFEFKKKISKRTVQRILTKYA